MLNAFNLIIHTAASMLGVFIIGVLVFWFIQDVTQKNTPFYAIIHSSEDCVTFLRNKENTFDNTFSQMIGMNCLSIAPPAVGFIK